MYRLNPLNRNVLITTDEVIAKAPIEQDVDVRNLQNAIEIAEERFIVPMIGDKMYEDFITMKNVVVTSGNKAALQTSVNAGNTGPTIVLVEGQIVNAIEKVTNTWYVKVWNRYLWRICAECVAYVAIPTNAIKSASQGEMQNNPSGPMGGQGASAVPLQMLKFKMDKILQDRIDPLIEAMRVWLCANKGETDLALWDSSSCESCQPTHKKMNGFVYGVYDDYKNNCECSNDNY
jgi:hypothetical protein